MQAGSTQSRAWAALGGRVAVIAVCLLVLQQCSKPTGSSTGPSPNPPSAQPPTTPTPPTPAPPGPATFVGTGDIAICDPTITSQAEATARLVEGIGGQVFTLGDNAYPNGTRENFRDCYDKTWGRFKDRTRPTPGNHEYNSPGAQPYYEYFGASAGPAGLGYYSYPVGGWHVISLNSSEPSGGQEAWLRQDLAANATSKCTLAYWHYPVFSSGPNFQTHNVMRGIYRILYDANVDVVLTGHDHMYERFAPQDADGRPDAARGIRQFVVGSGGVPLYSFMTQQPGSEMRHTGAGAHGVLKMTLSADAYAWEFITTGRGTLDSGTTACH